MVNITSHIQSCMEYLSSELDVVILRQVLANGVVSADVLEQSDWSIVLRFLDEGRGRYRDPKTYKTNDVQCQLRMLTERLGSEGYPFDNPNREVSTYASELRIFRNRWAHLEEFSPDDAVRIYGTAARLFTALGEYQRASYLESCRDRIRNEIFGFNVPEAAEPEISDEVRKALAKDQAQKPDAVVPSGAFVKSAIPKTVPTEPAIQPLRAAATLTVNIEDKRYPFEAWQTVPMGEPTVFESMRNKTNTASIRATASEIAEFEGPIELNRLCRLVTYCFGLGRAYKNRLNQVSHQVRNNSEDLTVDEHGFVWPESIDRETWAEFRPHAEISGRAFEEISPVEIANAWRYFDANPELLDDGQDVQSAVLATFGRKRCTAVVKKHLELAKTLI